MTLENALAEERKQNFIDAICFKEPKKIPVGGEFITWPLAYAGTTYRAVKDDAEMTAKAYTKFMDDIEFDYMWGGCIYNPVDVYQILGNKSYTIGEDDVCIEHRQTEAFVMDVEDYELLIKDPVKFREDTFLRHNFPALMLPKEEAYAKLKEAAIKFKIFYEANKKIMHSTYMEKQIISFLGSPINYSSPFNRLFDQYRGIVNSLGDLRRRPKLVKAACDAIWAEEIKRYDNIKPQDVAYPFPLGASVYHAECFMNITQYDEFYFKKLKEFFLPYFEAGAKIFLKGEGQFIRFLDRFRELPKGAIVMMLDEDDPFEVHKIIGDWDVLATGIRVDLLKYGTKQQCVDYVKRSFDTFAPGGGFIFMQNKPLMCAADAKVENIIAAYETANELSKG